MSVEVRTVGASGPPASTTSAEAGTFEERWAAWLAKSDAHDRAVRRKLALAAPFLFVAAAVFVYILLVR